MKTALSKTCPACGERYEPAVLFCPSDGTPLTTGARALSDPSGSEVDPYLGLELEGQIRLTSLVGIGSMGRVYRAFQSGIDRDVAVKILHRELLRNVELVSRFHREAKIASRLVHPNVVQVLMAGALPYNGTREIGSELYLVMEYLDGISLLSALAAAGMSDGGAFPLARALHVVLQLCDAVGEAHAQGVVHRDVKPENIMLVRRGEDQDFVKVLDFGIARQDLVEGGVTQAGLIFGTAKYISPEGAEGRPVGTTADVYSIATILYQCLAGQTPFDAESPMALLMQQIQSAPPPLLEIERASYVPEPLAAVIMRNLSKSPEDRAPDARALRRDLMTATRASGLSLDGLLDQGGLKLDSKQRTKNHDLSVEVAQLARRLSNPDADARAPEVPRAPVSSQRGSHSSIPVSSRQSRSSVPGSARPGSSPPAGSAPPPRVLEGGESGDDTLRGMSEVPGAALLAGDDLSLLGRDGDDLHRSMVGPTMPGLPLDEEEAFDEESGREGHPSTIQGHMIPQSERSGRADLAVQEKRRSRALWIAAIGFMAIVVPVGALAGVHFWSGGSAQSQKADQDLEAAKEARRLHAWDSPKGSSLKDLTEDALRRYPEDKRFVTLRKDAAGEVLAEALERKYAGAHDDALRLALLASTFDPSLGAASHLAAELEKEAQRPTVDPAGSASSIVASAPVWSKGHWRTNAAGSSAPSALPAPSTSAVPSSSAKPANVPSAALPFRDPPPLPEDPPQPPNPKRPWL